MADFLKIAILGAPGVGKTAIIQQFLWNQFAEDARSPHGGVYRPSVVLNDRIYHLVILDIPASLVFTNNQQMLPDQLSIFCTFCFNATF
ncbi:ras-like protein family member 10A [Heterodontus francisci]|uniref:ras-like protein family member 10A n=1 Tax=Heterodontus francisci TaxID=7792 RepID=UPI00355ADB79